MAEISFYQVRSYLNNVEYPVQTIENLVRCAIKNGADAEVIAVIERLPDKTYETPEDLDAAIENAFDDVDLYDDYLE